jgi:hypothetical protein
VLRVPEGRLNSKREVKILTLNLSGTPDSWQPRANFKRPSGTQTLLMGQPGDKSPGYYRMSLRDERLALPQLIDIS